ncbi:hypothetical protein LOAG_14024 [Loa loa]|uniref:Uncharacterized protein n=1 Tax=Loa loa TaxID=7209 RepID=A0A1S0TJF0_LOALO|nr:hypothetical protein LOAG_14024 [Loa loa]EFO14496.1 hypothetical protein LOAG_14024 [Loa loa]
MGVSSNFLRLSSTESKPCYKILGNPGKRKNQVNLESFWKHKQRFLTDTQNASRRILERQNRISEAGRGAEIDTVETQKNMSPYSLIFLTETYFASNISLWCS